MKKVFLISILLLSNVLVFFGQEPAFQFSHRGNSILHLKFSPDASRLISYSSGNQDMCLWEVKSGRLIWKRPISFIQRSDESYTLNAFAWSSDQNFIATGSVNGTVQLWDAKTGKFLWLAEAYRKEITYLSFSAAGQVLLAVSAGVTKEPASKLLRAADGQTLSDEGQKIDFKSSETSRPPLKTDAAFTAIKLPTSSTFDLSDDGNFLAQEGGPFYTSILITDIKSGKTWPVDGHPSNINVLSYSPDGKVLAAAGNDGSIYFFDPGSHALLKTLAQQNKRITALAFSPDGSYLISGDDHSELQLWEVSSAKLLKAVKISDRDDDIEKLEFSKTGKLFSAFINGSLSVWDAAALKPRKVIRTMEGYRSTSGYMTSTYSSVPINSAAFSAEGDRIITGHQDGTLRIWNAVSGAQTAKFKLGDSVSLIAIAPGGQNIVAIVIKGDDKSLQLIDVRSGKVLRQTNKVDIDYLEKISISGDGKYLAASDNIGGVALVKLDDMSVYRALDFERSGNDSVVFGPDGRTFFTGGENQNISQYDLATGVKLWQLIPDFRPGESEVKLEEAKKERVAAIVTAKNARNAQAAIDVENFRGKVFIIFDHYGDMSDPGEKRMLETDEPKESVVKKTAADANAVWLRLRNDSPLPIDIPTVSMYLPNPKCFHLFSDGEKMLGSCDNREVGIWFGVKDKKDEWVPYGFDFGSSTIILPGNSVLFPVPLALLEKDHHIVFSYNFQNVRASENDRDLDYGEKVELKFGKDNLPR